MSLLRGKDRRMTQIVPVILCGGSGTRLWPRSRASKPKPFLPLVGSRTLFEETLARCGWTQAR
jgi:mannose-1-phosphate guanylyltransferase/mannose-1-phosphate guanylyltransferase/mannose-6-phosphate isomerase